MRFPLMLMIIGMLIGILSACGQKGPLYLPETKKSHQSNLPKAARD